MADILFTELAAHQLHALLSDPSASELAGKVRAVIGHLRADPGDAAMRRRRVLSEMFGPCWVVPVRGFDDNYWVMWRLDDGTPTVCYVGPEP